jgi:hypothetical protein
MPYNEHMSLDTKTSAKQTYLGVISLLLAILSVIFLATFFAISQMNISPATFSSWSNIIGLIYCFMTPAVFVLAILAWRKKKDSRLLAGIAVAVIGIPFLILLSQFVFAISLVP